MDRFKLINRDAAREAIILLMGPPVSILWTALCFWLMDQFFNEVTTDTYRAVAFFCVSATCLAGLIAIFSVSEDVRTRSKTAKEGKP